MESNIKQELTHHQILTFLQETEPYYDLLVKIQSLKPKKYLFNPKTGKVTDLNSEDTPLEIEIKNKIESIKQLIFNKN